MLKIILVSTLFFNMYSTSIVEYTQVNYIEYSLDNYQDEILKIGMEIETRSRDILTLSISLMETENVLESYSDSLTIKGKKKTSLKLNVGEEVTAIKMVINSENLNKEIENVNIPFYPLNKEDCALDINHKVCISDEPIKVRYSNGEITEEYEVVELLNDNLTFKSINNLVPLNKIKIYYNQDKIDDGNVYLLVNDNYYNLEVTKINNMINLSFLDNYYLDYINQKFYEEYKEGLTKDNNIILKEDSLLEISFENSFISFNDLKIEINIETSNYYGNCNNSTYCIRRIYK